MLCMYLYAKIPLLSCLLQEHSQSIDIQQSYLHSVWNGTQNLPHQVQIMPIPTALLAYRAAISKILQDWRRRSNQTSKRGPHQIEHLPTRETVKHFKKERHQLKLPLRCRKCAQNTKQRCLSFYSLSLKFEEIQKISKGKKPSTQTVVSVVVLLISDRTVSIWLF